MEHIQRIHALYVGNVQGVGFRFAAKRIAGRMDIKGYVKNLTNGNVEVIGEGDRERLKAFLDSVKVDMREYIRDCHVEWQSASGEFGSFEIKF